MLNIDNKLLIALKKNGINTLNDIQKKAIKIVFNSNNTCIVSPTGSGKTLCFIIPILQQIVTNKFTQSIIITPSNILGEQIKNIINNILKYYNNEITCMLIDKKTSTKKFSNKGFSANILVGTPDNIDELIVEKKSVNLVNLNFLVIDEIDYMLSNDFIRKIDKIYDYIYKKELKTILTSATLNNDLKYFLKKYIRNINLCDYENEILCKKSNYIFQDITGYEEKEVLEKILKHYNPYLALIFVNTKKKADELYQELKKKKENVCTIHGDISPRNRKRILKEINKNKYQYIIATDLLARGIDIKNISHIFNLELPPTNQLNFFIHRCGRTNREGANFDGLIFSFYKKNEKKKLDWIRKKGIKINIQDIKKIIKKDKKLK